MNKQAELKQALEGNIATVASSSLVTEHGIVLSSHRKGCGHVYKCI